MTTSDQTQATVPITDQPVADQPDVDQLEVDQLEVDQLEVDQPPVDPGADELWASRLGLYRRRQGRVVAGVAGGLADRIGVGDGYVRAAFATLATMWGLGVVAYVVVWRMTLDVEDDRPPRVIDSKQRIGLALALIGGLWMLTGIGIVPDGFATAVVFTISFGLAALWDRSESPSLARIILPDGGGSRSVVRLIGGMVLVIGGLGLLFSSVSAVSQIGFTLLAVAVTVAGLLLAFGPWIYRLAQDLGQERRERVRQEERAEVAAHLHDSVLQTLALIQRSEDPRKMASLARSQERELRGWLYGRAPVAGEDLLSTALEAAVAKVEDDRHVAIDLVKVGDATLDDRGRALVGAATEALINAAQHSGAGRISMYLEVEGETAEVFVTDQGKGFDQAIVPPDRRGLADSVFGRMLRHGGSATVESRPGEGTEVHLVMPGMKPVGVVT
jgi:signal transduction histidine kinase/phage shock protein PspC (stress-responsive transcriptional regulator)